MSDLLLCVLMFVAAESRVFQLSSGAEAHKRAPVALIPEAPAPSKAPICPAL